MKGGGIIFIRRVKVFLGRQVNGISHASIKSPVALIVPYVRAGSGKDVFRFFNRFPLISLICELNGRNTVNLFGVEDVGKTDNGFIQFDLFFFRLAVRIKNGLAVYVQLVFLFAELEIDYRCGLAAGQDAVALVIGLFQRHPARIVIAGKRQMHPVHASVHRTGGGIMGSHSSLPRMPGDLPRGCAFL